MFKILLGTSKP